MGQLGGPSGGNFIPLILPPRSLRVLFRPFLFRFVHFIPLFYVII